MAEQAISEQLRQAGLRSTKDRRALLTLFQKHRTWTAAQLHKRMPETDLSTIYRNLQQLVEHGLLDRIHAHEQETHYERRRSHHDHLLCNACHVLECITCPVPQLKTHRLELSGVCSQCKS